MNNTYEVNYTVKNNHHAFVVSKITEPCNKSGGYIYTCSDLKSLIDHIATSRLGISRKQCIASYIDFIKKG